MTSATKRKIAAARRGRKWPAGVRAKIGAGVRRGERNKIQIATRVDADLYDEFRARAQAAGLPIAQALEIAMAKWIQSAGRRRQVPKKMKNNLLVHSGGKTITKSSPVGRKNETRTKNR